MVEIIVKTRQWGNSIGVTIPKEIAEKEKIGPNEEITIDIKKTHLPDPKSFGALKGWKIDAQKMKDQGKVESDW